MTDEYPMIPPELFSPRHWMAGRFLEPRASVLRDPLQAREFKVTAQPHPMAGVWDDYVAKVTRRIAQEREERAKLRFRTGMNDGWDWFYGTPEDNYPVVAEIARKHLNSPTGPEVPPAGKPNPVWIEGQERFQCADLGFTEYAAGSDIPIYTHPGVPPRSVTFLQDIPASILDPHKPRWGLAPGDYAIEEYPNGVRATRVTEGNGWGHVSIVTEAPPYPVDYLDDDDAWDEAEGQEWVDQVEEDRLASLIGNALLDDDVADDDLTDCFVDSYVDFRLAARAVMDDREDRNTHLLVQIANALNSVSDGPEFTLANKDLWPRMIAPQPDCVSCGCPELVHCEDGCQPPAARCECAGYWAPDPKPTTKGAVDAPPYLKD